MGAMGANTAYLGGALAAKQGADVKVEALAIIPSMSCEATLNKYFH